MAKTKIRSIIQKTLVSAVVACSLALVGLPVYKVLAAESWGPQGRTEFSCDHPANYPVFNSMVVDPNSPECADNDIRNTIGNERNFVKIKEYGTAGLYTDDVTLEIGKEYEVYVYYHNNASASLNKIDANGDGWPDGLAREVRLKSQMPSKLSKGEVGVVMGRISAINTTPLEVWDSAYMHANDTVYLRYVTDSTVIHNRGGANGQLLNGDNMFSEEGTYLGHGDLFPNDGINAISWGMIPACNEYAGYVTYRIKVDQPKFMLNKEVSNVGKNNWTEKLNANGNDILEFRVRYENRGTTEQDDVSLFDKLPAGLEYQKGTTYLKIDGKDEILVSDDLFGAGLNIAAGNGVFPPGTGATLRYKVRVVDECGTRHMTNEASVATENGTMYDSAVVNVDKKCDVPKELPYTGPLEIGGAVLGILSLSVAAAYFYRSQMELRKIQGNDGK